MRGLGGRGRGDMLKCERGWTGMMASGVAVGDLI